MLLALSKWLAEFAIKNTERNLIPTALCALALCCSCGAQVDGTEVKSTSDIEAFSGDATESSDYTESGDASGDLESADATEESGDSSINDAKTESVEEPEQEYIVYYTDSDASDIAKLLLRECGGVQSKTEQACVAWVVLNRVDAYNSSIYSVLRSPGQFAFYESTTIRSDLLELAYDVLKRWNDEKNGYENVGRVLPKEYLYFSGDGSHNYFRTSYSGGSRWDYSLESPYDS